MSQVPVGQYDPLQVVGRQLALHPRLPHTVGNNWNGEPGVPPDPAPGIEGHHDVGYEQELHSEGQQLPPAGGLLGNLQGREEGRNGGRNGGRERL